MIIYLIAVFIVNVRLFHHCLILLICARALSITIYPIFIIYLEAFILFVKIKVFIVFYFIFIQQFIIISLSLMVFIMVHMIIMILNLIIYPCAKVLLIIFIIFIIFITTLFQVKFTFLLVQFVKLVIFMT